MRRMWNGLWGLTAALCCVAGCWNANSHLKPPPPPEEFRPPPEADNRYCNPPQYPREALDSGTFKKPKGTDDQTPKGPGFRGGAGGPGGMGGMGGGGVSGTSY